MTQFCISCGAALRPNVKFCTKCGATTASDAISADVPIDAEAEAAPLSFKRYLPHILGTLAILAVIAVGGTYLFGVPKSELPGDYNGCADGANAAKPECAEAAPPEITGQVTSMYILADANVRDRPTAKGSNIIDKIFRGTSISGILQIGEDGTSQWFRLDGNAGFIGAVNLSFSAPPKLAKTFADMKWNVEKGTDLLATPAAGSAVVAHLNPGDQTTIAGVTENGFAEVKRSKGGVGYFFITLQNDASGYLLATPKAMSLQFNRSQCSYGPDFDPLFKMAQVRQAEAVKAGADETTSGYTNVNGLLFGLHVTAVGSHYESTNIYFLEDSGAVVKAFLDNGFRFEKNDEFVGYSLVDGSNAAAGASVADTGSSEMKYGKSAFGCGF